MIVWGRKYWNIWFWLPSLIKIIQNFRRQEIFKTFQPHVGMWKSSTTHLICGGLIPCESIVFSNCLVRNLAISNSCFTFHKCVSHNGSRQRCFLSASWASKTAPRNVSDFPIDKDMRAQQPPRSDLAKRALKYLKYMCSRRSRRAEGNWGINFFFNIRLYWVLTS